jgi:hypothetical protein
MQMFIFAKCAAPFKGKYLPLHQVGARDVVYWCSVKLHVVIAASFRVFIGITKQLMCQK